MSILSAQQLAKYYGAQDIFEDVSFSVARGEKIALVGPNGAGKTTLLRILLGMEEPTAGSVSRARGLRMGYLPQKPALNSAYTLFDEMLHVFDDLRHQQRNLLALAEQMAVADDPTELMEQYARAEHRFDHLGGYEYESRIKRVLGGLGFGPDTYEWPVGVLSGGQITRALLGKLLLEEPDLLVLDEPSNYLDLAALEWLESYLGDWKQSLLIVSHDRYFLDKVVSRVWELNHGRLDSYRGNYTHFVEQRQARRLRQQREFEAQQELIAKTEDFFARYHAGQRSKEARGRMKKLGHLERIDAPQTSRQMSLRISTRLRSGDDVLQSQNAVIGYPTRPDEDADPNEPFALLSTGKFLIQRGHRIALLGPNGSGKSTLLRTILGEIEPLEGRIRIGASVHIGYLPQTQDWLDTDQTVLGQILELSNLQIQEARSLLGRFLFSGDDVEKRVGDLSGGERARLALAILTMRGANFLLLDEPTTHLDVESQEVLQSVLLGFEGTILLVSHDRYLIDALASHVWFVRDGTIEQFKGNYASYLEQTAQAAAAPSRAETPRAKRSGQSQGQPQRDRAEAKRARRIEELESRIEALEQRLEQVSRHIELASVQQDIARVQALSAEYQEVETELTQYLKEWESCSMLLVEEG